MKEVAISYGPRGKAPPAHHGPAVPGWTLAVASGPGDSPPPSLQPRASFLCGEHCPPWQPAFQSPLSWDQFQPTGQSGNQGRRPG